MRRTARAEIIAIDDLVAEHKIAQRKTESDEKYPGNRGCEFLLIEKAAREKEKKGTEEEKRVCRNFPEQLPILEVEP